MPRVLFLITSFDYAGAESQIMHLCRGLRSRNYELALVSMIQPVAYLDELKELGVEVYSLDMSKGIPDPRAIARFRRLVIRFQPDVVHSHLVHANLLARITRLFVRMPLLICTAHNINEGGRLRELLYRLTDPLCELTTNVSQEAVNRYIDIRVAPKHKIKLVPNGIVVDQFKGLIDCEGHVRQELGIRSDEFVWLAVGRLAPVKDYENMITAFSRVLKQHPHSVLLIAGIGPDREALEQLCHTLQVQQQVKFLGLRRDIASLMSEADAYLMSSKWEGLPMVLLEACASGLPIVATDVGGNKEVVHEGSNGYLAKPNDSQHLSDHMNALMSHSPTALRQMGEWGRNYVDQYFNMDVIIEQWTSIYEPRVVSQSS
ncbi:glycosyltransferase [Paenibacillus segetis]|uniref:Glycosyl transferase family 1 n=1 Tax=Paenibacillus segetis TaxID=1325360 RepID=A0ABQ1YP02_9BACL|nr:glycosyltransferase [Paenibacillus segetis]GGH32214.1 glycosyl transferase family 1 [Paenibacillus segetis]